VTVTIRKIDAPDEERWRVLWDGYNRFYEREVSEDITRHTWARLLDPASALHAIVAAQANGRVIGIANFIIHESTSAIQSVCYLQDLYVDPDCRSRGVGKQLIDWLKTEMEAQRWSRLYWHTRETNYRARGLYDKYGPHSGFVRYVILNPNVGG
jgi:ribosomal protein S18 acetylase RimI-like enzyme